MIYPCVTCLHHRTSPKGEERCAVLDMHLHKNPSHGKCILYEQQYLPNCAKCPEEAECAQGLVKTCLQTQQICTKWILMKKNSSN